LVLNSEDCWFRSHIINLKFISWVRLRLELCWLLEPIALRIHYGYYGQRNLSDWGISTACATVIGATDHQEVIVFYLVGVACRLHIGHHKLIFHWHRLHHSLLLFLCDSRVCDLFQVDIKIFLAFFEGSDSWFIVVCQVERISVSVWSATDGQILLNSQSHIAHR